jgi:hypothetical protein
MAHPYAPMGGSYDDRVVGIVTDEFLKAGWIVGTFNFRYALNTYHVYIALTRSQRRPQLQVPHQLVRPPRTRRLHLLRRILHTLRMLPVPPP